MLAAQQPQQWAGAAAMAQRWAAGSAAADGGGSDAAWPQAARVQALLQELAALSADGPQPPASAAASVDLGAAPTSSCVRFHRTSFTSSVAFHLRGIRGRIAL